MQPTARLYFTFPSFIIKTLVLVKNELRKNWIALLLPTPFIIYFWIHYLSNGNQPYRLDLTATWTYLLLVLLMAMIYGLQCFSHEADKKSLDFILTRPLSPYQIIGVKFVVSLSILIAWFFAFQTLLLPALDKLGLPQGMGSEWLWLILIVLYSAGFFSGLIAKGLERFFMIIVVTGSTSWGSYFFWSKLVDLVKANLFWPDVSPMLLTFLSFWLPIYLCIISLLVPIIGSVWFLRSRVKPWYFKPLWGITGLWLITYLLIIVATHIFAPPIWPGQIIEYGDWHDQGNIVVSGPVNNKLFARNADTKPCYLAVLQLGQHFKPIYKGFNIMKPRISPNGKWIAFSDNGKMKLLNLTNHSLNTLGNGHLASWSNDSRQLMVAQFIGPKGLSRIYRFDIKSGQKELVTTQTYNLEDIAWNSLNNKLFLIQYTAELNCLDLNTQKIQNIPFTAYEQPEVYFGIQKPFVLLNYENGNLIIAQTFNQHFRLFIIDTQTNTLRLSEEKMDFRLSGNESVLINPDITSILWPRDDGTYTYQAGLFGTMAHHVHRADE